MERTFKKAPVINDDVFDVSDPKWAWPEVKDEWQMPSGDYAKFYDLNLTTEQKQEVLEGIDLDAWNLPSAAEAEELHFEVPGCPEEPETTANVVVFKPKNLKKKNNRCIFYCLGGAMCCVNYKQFGLPDLAEKHRAVVVTVSYRSSLYAQYPASINDCHAGFAWMIEHADELGIAPDKIVLHGMSTGGHISTALAFRLMRYGYRDNIRGIVAVMPITDDRETKPSHKIEGYGFNGRTMHGAYVQWMGVNYGSNRVSPEAFANHASVRQCVGYPPCYLHTLEFDVDRDATAEFAGKLHVARSFCELHQWGGLQHALGGMFFESSLGKLFQECIDFDIESCFNFDLRRPWVKEEDINW